MMLGSIFKEVVDKNGGWKYLTSACVFMGSMSLMNQARHMMFSHDVVDI